MFSADWISLTFSAALAVSPSIGSSTSATSFSCSWASILLSSVVGLRVLIRFLHGLPPLGPQPLEPATLALHLLLNREEAFDERLWPRWATRHVDIDRNHLVDAFEHRISQL